MSGGGSEQGSPAACSVPDSLTQYRHDDLPKAKVTRNKGKRPMRGVYKPKGSGSCILDALSCEPLSVAPSEPLSAPQPVGTASPVRPPLPSAAVPESVLAPPPSSCQDGSTTTTSQGVSAATPFSSLPWAQLFGPQGPFGGMGGMFVPFNPASLQHLPSASSGQALATPLLPPGTSSSAPPDPVPLPRPVQVHPSRASEQLQDWDEASLPDYQSDAGPSQFSVDDLLSESEQDVKPGSFKEALLRLQEVCPGVISDLQAPPSRAASATESALGISLTPSSKTPTLLESAMVTSAVGDAQLAARRSSVVVEQGALPDCSNALTCGKFLTPEPLQFCGRVDTSRLIAHSAVPASSLPTSHEDLLLASASPRRVVSLPDRAVVDFEEIARRALMSCTILDSFLGGLITSLRDPDQPSFTLRQDLEPADIFAFARTASHALRFTTCSVARLHLNLVLSRRDALLSSSPTVRDSNSRTALRHVPLSSSSLFSGQVQPVIRRQADASRDLSSCLPARRGPPPQPSSGPQSRPPAQSSGRPFFLRPGKARAPRFRGGRNPYSRRPDSPPQASAGGSSRR